MYTIFRELKPPRLAENFKVMSFSLMVGLLFACGGGGSSSSMPGLRTGVLLDSPVAGISYSTSTQSGTTNSQGEFSYQVGETVTFRLGGLELGQAAGATQVTLFDLAGVTSVPRSIEDLYAAAAQTANRRSFHTAVNIGVLLQTMDADGIADNGIEITPQVAALFDADSLWLAQPSSRFQTSHRLRQILRAASAEGLLTDRDVVADGAAFAHMLAQADMDSMAYFARDISTDNDGLPGPERVYVREFSPEGRLISAAHDNNGDGNDDSIVDYTYNANGKTTSISNDTNGDGDYNQVTTYRYSSFGELLRRETVDANNTTLSLEVRTYNDQGVMVRQELTSGSQTRFLRWGTDGNGTRTWGEYDNDADGSWDRHDDLVYDDQDRWVDRFVDMDFDGNVDQRWQRSYNALGLLTSDSQDTDYDGTVDSLQTWRYNDNGQSLEHVRMTADVVTYRDTSAYDSEYRLTRKETDWDGDGTVDTVATMTYTTNDEGNERRISRDDFDANGTWDRIQTTDYNAAGKVISRVTQADLETTPTTTTSSFAYDELGRLVTATTGAETVRYSDFAAIPLGYLW